MKYIRQIRVDGSRRSTADISRIRFSYSVDGPLYEQRSTDAVRAIESRISDYRVVDATTGLDRPVSVRRSRSGAKCIATVENDRPIDSLLTLSTF
jgi:hypothetical protein